MSFVKWLRKNNTKIMAIVVVVLMIGFIGGSYIQQFARRSTRMGEAVAHFGEDKEITHADIYLAQQELEILKLVRADAVLRSQDLRGLLLAELLFSEPRLSSGLIGQVQNKIKTSGIRISERQINDIYRQTQPTWVYWLLLKKEAEAVGFKVTEDEAGNILAMTTPKLFDGRSYQQLVTAIMRQHNIAEEEILSAFSKLLTVLQYAKITCSGEDLTSGQIMHEVSREEEKIDAEFVRFSVSLFAKKAAEPAMQQIEEQFSKYKGFFAGHVDSENPYGFGYKLPDRVQLEYIAVKLADVEKIITAPTNEEMEEYYQKNIDNFTATYRTDPNDPNSPTVQKPRSYGEVVSIVSKLLRRGKLNTAAEGIINQAKELTEARLQSSDIEASKLTGEKLKELSGDYASAAKQLSEKHGIKVYAGKTGQLSAGDMQSDESLGMSFAGSYKFNPVPLTKLVFAVDELSASELGPFDPAKPKMYENIGPVQNPGAGIMMLVRIIKAEKASEPENIEQTFSTACLELDSDANEPSDKVYSVKKDVVEDLKKLAAMDITKARVDEFIVMVKKDGWDSAIRNFNKLYGEKRAEEPNTFELQTFKGLQRFSSATLKTFAVQNYGDPLADLLVNQFKQQYLLVEQLYSLIPQDSNTVANLPVVYEFKPTMSYYCLKNLSVKRLRRSDFERLKAEGVFKEDFLQSQDLAAVFFNPDNIVRRTNFKWVKGPTVPVVPDEAPELPEGDF